MGSVYRFITAYYSDGRNYYIESLEKNLETISILASDISNVLIQNLPDILRQL
ncbi:unnamed protein product, partial [marine sediment metagenome]